MITTPVAIARALIVALVVWAIGAGIVVGLFRLFDASSTIDLGGSQNRVQIVWLGSHAFVACMAALVGVLLGGVALTNALVTDPKAAAAATAAPVLVVTASIAGGLSVGDLIQGSVLIAMLVGLVIGTTAGAFFITLSGTPESPSPFGHRSSNAGVRGWGSR